MSPRANLINFFVAAATGKELLSLTLRHSDQLRIFYLGVVSGVYIFKPLIENTRNDTQATALNRSRSNEDKLSTSSTVKGMSKPEGSAAAPVSSEDTRVKTS
ncbi:hypothetical protein ACEPAI_494 [Sanghuangporus weigelae]